MRRIKLTVAYDGTNYHGWQEQLNGITIEGVLNKHLSELFREEIKVIGASRTDAGVHALCNVAVFDTSAQIRPDKIAYALNQRLPQDIRIRKSEEVAADFHPRHTESRKTYEYRIFNEAFANPLKRQYTYFTYTPLNVFLMKEAAPYLEGEHDFKSFCSTSSTAETTVRTIYGVTVEQIESEIIIRVTGSGFLYNMVRIIAGTLIEIGRGKYPPVKMADILEARDRTAAGPTAPACGLTLIRYQFMEKTTDSEEKEDVSDSEQSNESK